MSGAEETVVGDTVPKHEREIGETYAFPVPRHSVKLVMLQDCYYWCFVCKKYRPMSKAGLRYMGQNGQVRNQPRCGSCRKLKDIESPKRGHDPQEKKNGAKRKQKTRGRNAGSKG